MSEPVFVDASAWVAITNRKDRYHDEALRVYHHLLRSGTPLITSTWTAYEALTIVKTKLGHNQAERLWQRMLRPSVVSRQAFAFDRHFIEASKQYGFSLVTK